MQFHTTDYKAYKRDKVLWMAQDAFNGWSCHGVIVIQRDGIMETMYEGGNGRIAIGSTVLSMCDCASTLVPGVQPGGPPYTRPCYDGDQQRLKALVGELILLFQQMNAIVRRDLPDLPQA